ncbi:MAG: DNRLRE domain-containing protein [Terriglobales bacterium]
MLAAQLRLVTLLSPLLILWASAQAQVTPSQDSFTNTSAATTNYGANVLLDVDGAKEITYIQFNLASIPSGASVSQATLKLYVNAVTTAGSFNVDYVTGAWEESTLDANNAPSLGASIASSVSITTADKNQYILINVTSALQAWLSGSQSNDGLALVANSTFDASFDSKESKTTSHPPELDVVFAGSGSGITGIDTASGSGLIGGGTSGTLNLSLTNACSTNQVLQWNGTSWICASVGTGTITGVTAGTDLTGGGTSGNVTLNLNTANVPQLNTANTFTSNQRVNGNLTATGSVSGGIVNAATNYDIGGTVFDIGSVAIQSALLGFSGNATMTGGANTASGWQALANNTTGSSNVADGKHALLNNTTGSENTAVGVRALYLNTTGEYNTATGYQALAINSTGFANTATGYEALYANTTGLFNSAAGYAALDVNTTGNSNTGEGAEALGANTTGSGNTATGYFALASSSSCCNVAVGYQALQYVTTGQANTGVGYNTGNTADGSNISGNNNTLLGTGTVLGAGTLTNATALGANAEVDASNSLVLGSINGVNGQTATVKVGIGTTTPSNVFTIASGAGKAIADGWSTYSSRRWKTNIQTLQGALAKVEQLRGVSYDLRANGKHEVGVIAEEVGAVVPEIVTWENNGKDARGVDYDRLTALLIEATKEQQRQFEQQWAELRSQAAALRNLKSELRATRQSLQKVKAQLAASQTTVVAAK